MMISKKALPRRTILKGMGAAIALPLLDAMVPAMTALADTPVSPRRLQRLGFVYTPMGCDLSRWTPPGEDLSELPSTLSPLAPVRDHVTAISNLKLNNVCRGTHAKANAAFLNCSLAKQVESTDFYSGMTVDQIAAQQIGQATRFPSLEISMDVSTRDDQFNEEYAHEYPASLSWSSPITPLTPKTNPRTVFEMLFGAESNVANRRAALNKQVSLLDSVSEEIARLRKILGPDDRTLVSDYLQSVRDVEQRIQQTETNIHENALPDLHRPMSVPSEFSDNARLMFDLQLLAFQGDITRVISFQLDREASTRTYPEIGVSDSHDSLMRHGNDPVKLASLAKINRFHMSLFSEFLQKLQSTVEGEGTLLDHSLYVYGSGLGDSHLYDHHHLPIMVAGGAAAGMRGDRHIKLAQPTPLANLHLTLLDQVGIHLDSSGNNQRPIDELFEQNEKWVT